MTRVGECDVPIRVAEFGLDTMNTHGCTSVGMPLKSVARPSCLDKASNELPKLAGNKKLSNPSLRRLVRPSSKISVLDGRFRQSGNKLQSLVEQITYKDVCNKEIPFQDSHLPQADDRGDHRTSYEEALSNSINILCGVGILSIPFALKEGGWASLGVLGLFWCCTRYTAKILGRCQTMGHDSSLDLSEQSSPTEKTRLETYEDIGQAAFGTPGRNFISSILYIELIGTCGLFYILAGDHLQSLFGGNSEFYMILSAALMIPSLWLEDLEELSKLGVLGMISTAILVGLLGLNLVSHPTLASTAAVHPHSLPITFGLLAFVFAGHAVFPSIYSSMREPQKYEDMIDNTYVVVGLISLAVGVLGYAMYGNHTMEEITMNLPDGVLKTLGTGLIVINPFTKFALTMNPVGNALDKALGLESGSTPSKASRSSLGVLSLFLATSVPHFAYCMSLIGSFLTVTVSILFPSVCYLKLKQRPGENSLSDAEVFFNVGILIFGIACAASGTYQTFSQLLDQTS